MRIIPADLDDPRIIALLQTHVERALAVTPRESAHALDISGLKAPGIQVWAAWDGDTLLGVAALSDLGNGEGEIKSMHTAEAARGQGVASALLAHIVAQARVAGLTRLNLETGAMPYFAPARALYARHGFEECGPYGRYREDPNSAYMTMVV